MAGDPLLTAESQARITEAVERAESGTAGEIVVMLAARAGHYRSVVLMAALIGGLVVPWPLILLTVWSAGAILLVQAALVAIVFAAGLSEPMRIFLVPKRIRRDRARDAAHRAFRSLGLARTQGRTGILLYLSVAEHHAEIVADDGILAQIGIERWNATLADLLDALRRGEVEAGLIQAVGRIGTDLTLHVPAGSDDRDELPNRVIVTD